MTSDNDSQHVPDAWVEMPSEETVRAFMRSGHVYDFGFLTGMQRLVMSHLQIAPFFGALFMQIMFAPGALSRRSARWLQRSRRRRRTATTERNLTQSFCVSKAASTRW